jgi:hypothetical protein
MGHALALLGPGVLMASGGLDRANDRLSALASVELYPLSDGGYLGDRWARDAGKIDPARPCSSP